MGRKRRWRSRPSREGPSGSRAAAVSGSGTRPLRFPFARRYPGGVRPRWTASFAARRAASPKFSRSRTHCSRAMPARIVRISSLPGAPESTPSVAPTRRAPTCASRSIASAVCMSDRAKRLVSLTMMPPLSPSSHFWTRRPSSRVSSARAPETSSSLNDLIDLDAVRRSPAPDVLLLDVRRGIAAPNA